MVEDTGVWPTDVAHSFVAMLPKGGSGQPDDYRPIVLLSVYYRLWAKARGAPFQEFLQAAGIAPVGRVPSAEAQGFDLALRLAVSQSGGADTSGLALDWSKCYDHLVIDLLRQFGERIGMPAVR